MLSMPFRGPRAGALAARLLWWTGLSRAARVLLTRGGAFVLLLHGVASRKYPGVAAAAQPTIDAEDLRRMLRWLAARFRFLTPGELRDGRPGVLLTFDDGFANNCAVALPVLIELGAPAVFFVTTRHVIEPGDWLPATRRQALRHWRRAWEVPAEIARDLYDGMSREQLARCAEHPLITVGSHTVSHPFLTRCDDAALRRELVASKETLESVTGGKVDLFAYPTGDYDRRVAEAVRRAGYARAFAVNSAGQGIPAYEIPRVGIYAADPAYLGAKLSGLHRRPLRPARGPA